MGAGVSFLPALLPVNLQAKIGKGKGKGLRRRSVFSFRTRRLYVCVLLSCLLYTSRYSETYTIVFRIDCMQLTVNLQTKIRRIEFRWLKLSGKPTFPPPHFEIYALNQAPTALYSLSQASQNRKSWFGDWPDRRNFPGPPQQGYAQSPY